MPPMIATPNCPPSALAEMSPDPSAKRFSLSVQCFQFNGFGWIRHFIVLVEFLVGGHSPFAI